MEEVNHIKDTLIAFRSAADGTYELSTKQPVEYTDGYQVSIVRPEAFEQLSDNEWDRLTAYYCEYIHSRPHLGVYGGSAEVSFHSMTRPAAVDVMKEFNQESILKWEARARYPDNFLRWFLFNPKYDEHKEVNYHEILEKVQ